MTKKKKEEKVVEEPAGTNTPSIELIPVIAPLVEASFKYFQSVL